MFVWIDFTCPFCFIAMKRLIPLVKDSNLNIDLEIKTFLLNPNLKGKEDYIRNLSTKYNIPYLKAENMTLEVINLAKEDNIDLDFKKLRAINTINSHILLKYYEGNEKYYDIILKIFEKYFLEKKNINNLNVLEDILLELNIEKPNLKEILNDNKYMNLIERDIYQASTFKVSSVPTIVLRNGKKFIGVRTTSNYLEIITESMELKNSEFN